MIAWFENISIKFSLMEKTPVGISHSIIIETFAPRLYDLGPIRQMSRNYK